MTDEPDDRARLVVVCGLPGSGKTTLATSLAASMPAVRMCPDDWMLASGLDLWDAEARARIEGFQADLTTHLLASGRSVVIEWGTWARSERDALRDAARSVGAAVELRPLSAPADELWRRIVERDVEGRFSSRPITRSEVDEWIRRYEEPSSAERALYDPPLPERSDRPRSPAPAPTRRARLLSRPGGGRVRWRWWRRVGRGRGAGRSRCWRGGLRRPSVRG